MFEKIKRWYDYHLWTEDMVKNVREKNIITEDELYLILDIEKPQKEENEQNETTKVSENTFETDT